MRAARRAARRRARVRLVGLPATSCETYDLAASVIRTAEDYRDVTYEYLAGCAAEGAVYVELIASPDHARAVGLSDERALRRRSRRASTTPAPRSASRRGSSRTCLRNCGVEARRGGRAARRGEPPPLRRRLQHGRRRGRLPARADSRAPSRSRPTAAWAARCTRASTPGPSPSAPRWTCRASPGSRTASGRSRTRRSWRSSRSAGSSWRSARLERRARRLSVVRGASAACAARSRASGSP